jgi:PAS domain S-box-containing protein
VTPLILGIAYIVVHAAGGWVLRDQPLARSIFANIGLLVPPVAICIIILRRRAEWRGCQRLFWDTFAIGVGLWTVGHIGWAYENILYQRANWLSWHTVFSLCGGIGPLIALLARPHKGVRHDAVSTVSLVLGSYGVLAVFLYSYFVLVPSLVRSQAEAYTALLTLVQINRALLFAAMLYAAWQARSTPWRRTFGYLALGAGFGFFMRIVTSLAIANNTYQAGTLYDLAWIVPLMLYGMAALQAPPSPLNESIDAPSPTMPAIVSAIPVFLIPLIGYGGLFALPLGSTGDAFRALLTGLMTLAGLGLLTLRLSVQSGELQRRDSRLRLLAAATEQTADLILITRADGTFEHANDAFGRALGYSRSELSDLRFPALIEPGFESVGDHIHRQVREHGIWRGTLVRRRRDGSTFPAACTVVGLRDTEGGITHFVGVERDTTDELKLRDQLVHTERLSAIGELVAGVAHEINNPLQTIVGSAELLLEESPDPASRHDLEVVRREATRAGQIVRNLLSFVRRTAPDRVPADLNELVRRTVELREYHLQLHNIALNLDLHPAELGVLVNREEIQQIVLNLVINAEQAILSTADSGTIAIRTLTDGRHHSVEVVDSGPGVGPELQGRIFEPFFTTKDVGQGTGLGLSISHGIAASHAGSLELCTSGPGACFRLSLPIDPSRMRSPEAPAEPVARPSAEHGLALVVDDEPAIRKLVARLLERRGFDVLEAETGEAALDLAEKFPVQLVLCDVRMPGMSGPELYRALASGADAGPRPFIFITGDRAAVGTDGMADVPVLAKPFTAADLDAALESLIPNP